MYCSTCYYCDRIVGTDVHCTSMRHAKFMDILGTNKYQTTLNDRGYIVLKSSESLRVFCPDHETPEEHWEKKSIFIVMKQFIFFMNN